jgi:hypothetical protein
MLCMMYAMNGIDIKQTKKKVINVVACNQQATDDMQENQINASVSMDVTLASLEIVRDEVNWRGGPQKNCCGVTN